MSLKNLAAWNNGSRTVSSACGTKKFLLLAEQRKILHHAVAVQKRTLPLADAVPSNKSKNRSCSLKREQLLF